MTGLAGLRVLILEDEGPVALMLEDLLEDLGCELAASIGRLPQAWAALESVAFDFAVLDVNIAGETSFDFARALAEREIAFVFSTGYGNAGLPADLQGESVLTKPFSPGDLQQAAERALRRNP